VGSLAAALGTFLAGAPEVVAQLTAIPLRHALQAMFVLYGVFGVASALAYRRLPRTRRAGSAYADLPPLRDARRIVYVLAALFSLDAFAGGFIVQSLLARWLFQRFELSTVAAATIFFWTGALSAFSYLLAARIAARIGLVYTMVFTHLPSSVLLMLVPFAPNLATAVALLLARSALSQMDVPTRSSFVMAVVPAHERAAAASVTAVPRSLAAATSPLVAGYLIGVTTFGWPLLVAGALKIAYDLLFLALFRRHAATR
jgi:predicted MFS family arabinose efflux permease